jgi:hypothetical protein
MFELLAAKPGERFTARQIASWICKNYPQEAQDKLDRSPTVRTREELVQQLVAEIGSARPHWETKHRQLRSIAVRPRQYYWVDDASSGINRR